MIHVGEQVVLAKHEMPGVVVAVWPDGSAFQVSWIEGHDSPLSGGTFWHSISHARAGLIRANGHEPVPDLFEKAFRLAFEL